MLNQACLNAAKDVAQEIEDYWDATEEFSRDEKGQAGFMAPVGKGPEKQEKGGKQGGKSKNKGNMHEGLGFQPERGDQQTFWKDTAVGVGELATKKRSVGFNKSTQRAIHHKDPLPRDIREWTTPSGERTRSQPTQKEKERVTEQVKDKSHEKGTTDVLRAIALGTCYS